MFYKLKPKLKSKVNIQILSESKQNKCQFLLGLNYLILLIFENSLFPIFAKKWQIFV
jgi:hypothetical protein